MNIINTVNDASEAAVIKCSSKSVFLKILLIPQENTCVGASFQ